MEIKRTIEFFVETERRLIIPAADFSVREICPDCGDTMLTAEIVAARLNLNRRRVYLLVETGAVHFRETDAGLLLACGASVQAAEIAATRSPE
jgi:hypothetical protein